MDPELLAILINAMNLYFKETSNALIGNAFDTSYKGFVAADLSIGVRANSIYYSNAASGYASKYEYDLTVRGGSQVFDKGSDQYIFKPWFADAKESTRQSVADIINDGIRDGKVVGKKQSSNGNYPKGSIAYDIDQEINGKRKSWASMVARTESANITNETRLVQLKNRGVQKVRVWDNEGPRSCRACANANRQIWDIDYAIEHKLEHPNCVRRYQAILDGIQLTMKDEERLPIYETISSAKIGLLI